MFYNGIILIESAPAVGTQIDHGLIDHGELFKDSDLENLIDEDASRVKIEELSTTPKQTELGVKSRLFAYSFAGVMHSLAGFTRILGIDDKKQKQFNKLCLNLSKAVHFYGYTALGLQAYKDNRMMDSFAKLLEPILTLFAPIEDFNLIRGIAGGIGVLDYSQAAHADKSTKKKNIETNFAALAKIAKEMLNGLFPLSQRKVFVGPEREKGHTLALGGHMITISSLLGTLFKPLAKYFNIPRNIGAIISNTVAGLHPDRDKKISGTLYNIYAGIDIVQKFLPKDIAEIVNNFNMTVFNAATFIYGNLSHKRTQETFEHYKIS